MSNSNTDIFKYRHLDSDDEIPFSITNTVTLIRSLNYGEQRLLSEIVKQRENSLSYKRYVRYREHTEQLKKLLEEGWH